MKILRYVFLLLLLTFFISCSEDTITEPESYNRGDVIKVQQLIVVTPDLLGLYLDEFNIPPGIDLDYTVSALSIEYQTVDADGNLQKASGGLVIPQTNDASPLLSIQHGTVTEHSSVASNSPFSSVEGTIALITASNGYVTCVPDYLGFGVSTEIHPYIHAKSLAVSVIDFLRAVRNYCEDKNIPLSNQLFLGGYSEGGYATLATQREIEQNYSSEFTITANAPMAGPYDLLGTTKTILSQTSYDAPVYIAFLLTAYNNVYKWNRLNEMFNVPYAAMMNDLFDGKNSYSEIDNTLPKDISQLLKKEFSDKVLAETETAVISALQENNLLDWTPSAAIRFFHGDSDNTVAYENATTALKAFQDRGVTNIDLVTIPGANHETASLPAVLGMVDWLNSLRD